MTFIFNVRIFKCNINGSFAFPIFSTSNAVLRIVFATVSNGIWLYECLKSTEVLSLKITTEGESLIEHIDYFFEFINTERQSHWSSQKIQDNANKLIDIIENKEQPEQRTDEWYKYRYNMSNLEKFNVPDGW